MSQYNYYALLFEAKSIQQYLFDSGRLRDIIGASELIDSLTGQMLDNALAVLNLTEGEDLEFSRRAGGAFYAISNDSTVLQKLLSLYSLLVQQSVPDLAYDVGLDGGDTQLKAFDAARKKLQRDGAVTRPRLPLSSPLTQRYPRTGRAVEKEDRRGIGIDAATAVKKTYADISQAGFISRFSPMEAKLGWRDWPRNLEPDEMDKEGAFPFNKEDRKIALIHADGNGLGQLLINARKAVNERPEQFVSVFQELSRVITDATVHAAQQATREVLLPARDGRRPLPARPVLLGGDDLTILVRADLAMDFLRAFISAFETYSPEALQRLKRKGVEGLPSRLTIGAGLVYMRASQPFYLVSHLAESLMTVAKRRAKAIDLKNPSSSLSFYRVTGGLVDDYETIVKHELTHREAGNQYIDTLGCYFLGGESMAPRIEELLELAGLLGGEEMARGPTRQLLTLMGLSSADARTRYRRWRQLMDENKPLALKRFDELMERLLGTSMLPDLPYGRIDGIYYSPLADALALLGENKSDAWTEQEEEIA